MEGFYYLLTRNVVDERIVNFFIRFFLLALTVTITYFAIKLLYEWLKKKLGI